MSNTSIVKAQEEVQSLRTRLSNLRGRIEDQGTKVQSMAVKGATAFALGSYVRRQAAANAATFSLMGMDTKLTFGLIGYGVSQFVDGRAGELIESAAEACLTVYAYERGHQT